MYSVSPNSMTSFHYETFFKCLFIYVFVYINLYFQASVVLHMMEEDNSKVILRTQPFATAERLHDVIAETYKNLKNRKPLVQKSMALYLSNKDTEYILFKPIKVSCITHSLV